MASTNDLKNGMTLNLEGQLWNVVEFQHVKPGKGPAFVRTKLKNVHVRQGRRQDLQRRHQGGRGERRQARHAVPVPRGRRLRLHGHVRLRPAAHPGGGGRRRGRLPARGADGDDRVQRRHPAVRGHCPPRSSSSSRRPTRACRATARPAAPSPRRSRPARRSRCRCSSPPARRSRSTPAAAPTSAARNRVPAIPDTPFSYLWRRSHGRA